MDSNPFPKQAWLTIWIRPRATMRAILNSATPMRFVYWLVVLGGFSQAVQQVVINRNELKAAVGFATPVYLLLFVGGPVAGLFQFFISCALLLWTGGWLGSKGAYRQIQAAYAWGWVPMIAQAVFMGLIVGFPLLASRLQWFVLSEVSWIGIDVILVLSLLIAIIWSVVIFLKCLAVAQGFSSAGMALANVIVAWAVGFAIIVIPLALLAVVVMPALMNLHR